MDLKQKRRAGMYFHDSGKAYISVTEVLKVINKPVLQHWYGQQVYYAVVKDPAIDERAALASPYQVAMKAADRGTTIHSLIEAYKQSGSVIQTVPEAYKGYAQAFYEWANVFNPEILECERSIFNHEQRYAGTLDMLAKIGDKTFVVDFKTNKKGDVYSEAHMQVSAYLEVMRSEGVTDGIIVSLAENGTYTHKTVKDGYKAFLAALQIYKFTNDTKLLKLGWSEQEIYG